MFFYGETKSGHRVHMGEFIIQQNANQEDWVQTFCAKEMTTWVEGERPPYSRVTDFCKNCFRTYAWKVMVTQLEKEAVNESLVGKLEVLLDSQISGNALVIELYRIVNEEKAGRDDMLLPPERPVNPEAAAVS